jgi:hypothetical protein
LNSNASGFGSHGSMRRSAALTAQFVFLCLVQASVVLAQTTLPASLKAVPMEDGRYSVTFTLHANDIQEAYVTGDFNNWSRGDDRMTSSPGGVFTASIAMHDGEHEYSFYVDNRNFRDDPLNPRKVTDAVRGQHSAFRLGPQPNSISDEITSHAREFVARHSGDEPELFPARTRVQSVDYTTAGCVVKLSSEAVQKPWRPKEVAEVTNSLADALGTSPLTVIVGKRKLADFVPPYFRMKMVPREGPPSAPPHVSAALRTNASAAAPPPAKGLLNRNIVIWASHGKYYDNRQLKKWQWQRGRLFTTVEDLLPMSIVNPFLLPMLENAGCVVFNCRERDSQVHEVVVDDEDGTSEPIGRFLSERGFSPAKHAGFRNGMAPYPDGYNPHVHGKTHEARAGGDQGAKARAFWIPQIPQDGDYAVYVSYATLPESISDAHYTIHHAGGSTTFLVNQKMAGNTWVYLGTFHFLAGQSRSAGSVELTGESKSSGRVSADAVKFGGGMGDVQRDGQVSGYSRYAEAARYWFQYCGIDPKLIYAYGRIAGNEYTEDYVSRGEYVNYLLGSPRGPNHDPSFKGLNVPVDLSVALHTDAGITTGVVGTLGIHTIRDDNGKEVYPDGRSRMLNRDFADVIQTQIVQDVRATFCSDWTRRDLLDRSYAESRLPNVPAVLIELLSHQNYDDMKFALDPRFRFTVARAMYKGMLRFLATEYVFEPVITPLAPDHLEIASISENRVRVSWRPVYDPLEASAVPEGFVLYRREANGGFDNGSRVDFATDKDKQSTEAVSTIVELPDADAIYSFRVTAFNSGGESFPSETLPVRTGKAGEKRALIVNAFDRICAPEMVTGPQREGADRNVDRGVGYMWNSGVTGSEYDFDRSHAWQGDNTPYSNDNPGHGASYADLETTQELGNTFDFSIRHGQAFAACGWSFDSASDECVESSPTMLQKYAVVDWLLGEERTTMPPRPHSAGISEPDKMKPEFQAWPKAQQLALADYLSSGGRLLASGAYVASDIALSPLSTAADTDFLTSTLQCTYIANHASRRHVVVPSATEGPFHDMAPFRISSGMGEDNVYGVENPGAIEGLPKKAPAVLRYADGMPGAAVVSAEGGGRRVVLGFPFETIIGAGAREELLRSALQYLEKP